MFDFESAIHAAQGMARKVAWEFGGRVHFLRHGALPARWHAAGCYGYTTSTLARDLFGTSYADHHAAVLCDEPVKRDFPVLFPGVLSVVLHECGHFFQQALGVVGCTCEMQKPDKATQRAYHGPDWVRLTTHLNLRALRAGAKIDLPMMLHGSDPAARDPAAYANALLSEFNPRQSLFELIRQPAPAAFVRLWRADLAASQEAEKKATLPMLPDRVPAGADYDAAALDILGNMYLPKPKPEAKPAARQSVLASPFWPSLPALSCGGAW